MSSPGAVVRAAASVARPSSVTAREASSRRRITSAIGPGSTAITTPSRSAAPSSTPAWTTGVAAVTPGMARIAEPSAQPGVGPWDLGTIRTSAPVAYTAWSAWLRAHVAAWAEANVPSAAARISSSAARV